MNELTDGCTKTIKVTHLPTCFFKKREWKNNNQVEYYNYQLNGNGLATYLQVDNSKTFKLFLFIRKIPKESEEEEK